MATIKGRVKPRTIKRYKSISRIDQPEKHTHGWYVRVYFKRKQTAKFFPDKMHRGKMKALRAAIAFRDETERAIGKPRTDRPVVMRKARGGTGMVGVRQTTYRTRNAAGETRETPVYEVTWSPSPNTVRRTSVSIRKYGKREALRKAREIRRAMEQQYYGF